MHFICENEDGGKFRRETGMGIKSAADFTEGVAANRPVGKKHRFQQKIVEHVE